MTVYKIKHVASGMFYKPSKDGKHDINLSESGKCYSHRPDLRQFAGRTVRLGWSLVGCAFDYACTPNPEAIVEAFDPLKWQLVSMTTTERVVPWSDEAKTTI